MEPTESERKATLIRAGGMIREYREKKGWSVTDLGGRIGLDSETVSQLEVGEYDVMLTELFRVHKELGIPWAELFDQ